MSDTLQYLHSTMLLLYRDWRDVEEWPQVPFTFHYASTLSRRRETVRRDAFIYIPLCFYFISSRTTTSNSTSTFTFHYASTLSKDNFYISPKKLIYIPLCFYFIAKAPLVSLPPDIIYIPLCFYFILDELIRIIARLGFTFHYASTLSGTAGAGADADPAFTFHYASTLSDWLLPRSCL